MRRKHLSTNNLSVIVEKNWNFQRIYHRKPYHPEIPQLLTRIFADPDGAIENGKMLKNGDKTTVVKITEGELELVIKRYNIISFWHAIVRGLRHSRAHRCWVFAHLFKELALDTPEPIAMIEERLGPIRKRAYYVMLYRHGVIGRTAILDANQQQLEKYIKALVNDLQILHGQMITHGDLKATNWLWQNNQWIWLDLDATRQHRHLRSFTMSWYRDIRRLLKNWQDHPQILQRVKQQIPWLSHS